MVLEKRVDPSVSSTGDGVGFVSVDEKIPEERCVRTRGGGKHGAPLVHCREQENLQEKLLICVIIDGRILQGGTAKKKL